MRILAFGIAREIVGASAIEVDGVSVVGVLKEKLKRSYPGLGKLSSLMIAVNGEYANDDHVINNDDEIALIPPVSGG